MAAEASLVDAATEIIQRRRTFWATTRDLLRLWRETGAHDPHLGSDEAWHRWADVVENVTASLEGPRLPDDITAHERDLLSRIVAGAEAEDLPDAVHGIAWGLSTATAATFAPAWRDELPAEPHLLARGEAFPVADAPWSAADGLALSPRPASLSSPVGELPTVRFHDGSFDAWVDVRLERSLEAVAARLERVATVHPNERWDELDVPERNGLVFPVTPRDPEGQAARVAAALDSVLEAGPGMIVLPELCATAPVLEMLAGRLREHEAPLLVVAGSCHVRLRGEPENQAVALLAGTRRRMTHLKNVPFSDELRLRRPRKEGIRQRERLRVMVYPADRFRFAIAICRELLDARVTAAYDRLGVNVLAVPALTEKIEPFEPAVEERVARAQALSVVANGPTHDSRGRRLPYDTVIGAPLADRTCVTGVKPDDRVAIVLDTGLKV